MSGNITIYKPIIMQFFTYQFGLLGFFCANKQLFCDFIFFGLTFSSKDSARDNPTLFQDKRMDGSKGFQFSREFRDKKTDTQNGGSVSVDG